MKKKSRKVKNISEISILEQLLCELEEEIELEEGEPGRKMTKGQALIRNMVGEALEGDQRMMANVLKFMEKIDGLQAAQKEKHQGEEKPVARRDWEMMFYFFGRYQPHIELEIERLKKENPGAFGLKWTRVDLKDAPWYVDIHGPI